MDESLKLFTKLDIGSEVEMKNAEYAFEIGFDVPGVYDELDQAIPVRMKVQFKGDLNANFHFG